MTLIEKINDTFKNGKNKWNFITDEQNDVQIKVYIGIKEVDLQIFKIKGIHQNIGFNYANKTKTKAAILETIKTKIQI